MKAVRRLGLALTAGMLALSPASLLAQEAPPATSGSAPAPDAVGPKALQNFSLNGTVTQPAAPPQTQAASPAARQKAAEARTSSTSAPATTASSDAVPSRRAAQPRPQVALRDAPPQHSSAPPPVQQAVSTAPVTTAADLPASAPASAAPSSADFPAAPDSSTSALPARHGFALLPWLLAAIALGAGGAFLFWRNRSREAFAGSPQIDAFVAAEPAPAPAPKPGPPKAAPPPVSTGVVSTRLRPWVDIGFQPLRCILDEQKVTLEFDLELFNSGSAPARAVLAEASLLNAGAQQEQEIGRFFANPVGKGDRIAVIPPLQRFALKTHVSIARELLQAYDIGGRQVFVPLIAFNALYDWSGGQGQTSAAYLFGRDGHSDKLAPFRLDLGPHIFRGLAARILPDGVRQ